MEKNFKVLENKEFVDYISKCFSFNSKEIVNYAKSLIIIAIPSPIISITVIWNNIEKKIIIPPAYINMRSAIEEAEILLSNILNKNNHSIKRVAIPEKLLAVHSGLGKYGKNNICYIEGMGSFFRLVSFISNIQEINSDWDDINIMESCSKCNICLKRCPTGAIREDRYLIDGYKCLTFFNERPGEFPKWIDNSAHHCLVGCLFCQDKCPQNKKVINNINECEFFSERELIAIMNIKEFEKLDINIRFKLIKLNMDVYYNVLSRNLKVLL